MVDTGLLDWAGVADADVRRARPRSAGGRPRPARRGRRAGQPHAGRPGIPLGRGPRGAAPRAAATPRTRAVSCRAASWPRSCGAAHGPRREARRDDRDRSGLAAAGAVGPQVTDWAARIALGRRSAARRRARLLADARRAGSGAARRPAATCPSCPPRPAEPGAAAGSPLTGRYLRAPPPPATGWTASSPTASGIRSRAELHADRRGRACRTRPARQRLLRPGRGAARRAGSTSGMAGKVVDEGGLLVVTWELGDRADRHRLPLRPRRPSTPRWPSTPCDVT